MYFVVLIIKVTTCSAELCVLICDSHGSLFCFYECNGTSEANSEKVTKAKERKQ